MTTNRQSVVKVRLNTAHLRTIVPKMQAWTESVGMLAEKNAARVYANQCSRAFFVAPFLLRREQKSLVDGETADHRAAGGEDASHSESLDEDTEAGSLLLRSPSSNRSSQKARAKPSCL